MGNGAMAQSKHMKALKTALAKAVLADPKARQQLREYMAGHHQAANAMEYVFLTVAQDTAHEKKHVVYRFAKVAKAQ